MKIYTNIFLSFSILLFANCITEFDPPSQGYDNLLVVEAFLSDGDDPFEVKLSRSMPIDTSGLIPEVGATIRLYNLDGEFYNLREETNGRYQHPPINPQVGESYQLFIRTRDGNNYESSSVTMRSTPKIDSVTYRYIERPEMGLKGIQTFVNTHDPNNNTWYYRWIWDETWEFRTAYQSQHVYEDGMIFLREDNIYKCWKNSESTSIKIATSKNLTEDIISQYPIWYVTTATDRLGDRYSMNLKQYALSEESYNYWLELQKVTESLGTLFDPQPATVYGNIYNVNNETEVVLGFFDASTVEEKRIFLTRADMPPTRIPDYYSYCVDSIVSRGLVGEMVLRGYMLAYETQNEFGGFEYLMSDPYCIDCTIAGTNVKPDFW